MRLAWVNGTSSALVLIVCALNAVQQISGDNIGGNYKRMRVKSWLDVRAKSAGKNHLVAPNAFVERHNYDPNQTKDCNGAEANPITKTPIYETTGFIVLASVIFGYWLLTAVAIGTMIYWYFLRERFKENGEEEQRRSDSEGRDSRRNIEKSKRSRISEKSSTAIHGRSTSRTNREKRTNDEDESSEDAKVGTSNDRTKRKKKEKIRKRKHCVCM